MDLEDKIKIESDGSLAMTLLKPYKEYLNFNSWTDFYSFLREALNKFEDNKDYIFKHEDGV